MPGKRRRDVAACVRMGPRKVFGIRRENCRTTPLCVLGYETAHAVENKRIVSSSKPSNRSKSSVFDPPRTVRKRRRVVAACAQMGLAFVFGMRRENRGDTPPRWLWPFGCSATSAEQHHTGLRSGGLFPAAGQYGGSRMDKDITKRKCHAAAVWVDKPPAARASSLKGMP